MINNRIEYLSRRKKFYESKRRLDHSFKTLTQPKKKSTKRKLLPNTTLYPSTWTYLVSNKKHSHNITLAEFRKKELKPGDKVYFERGQIYNWGEYTVTADNVTFGSYGSGVDPVFLGSDNYGTATWTSETGGYYSTPLATAPLWVTINGECARQGESAWITSTANATTTTLTGDADSYNAVESLVGAKLRHKEFVFRLSYEHTITNYNSSTNVITIGAGGVVGGGSGLPFKLYGQKQFATLEGDWWYDDPNNELWIKTASDPTGSDIRVITEEFAFYVTGTNVTIQDIEFTQYFESAIQAPDTPGLTLTNLNVHDNRESGFILFGNLTVVTASNITVERCGMNAFHIGAIATSSTFTGCTVNEIGEQANIGWPTNTYWIKTGGCAFAFFWDSAETVTTPIGVTIENCEMTNLGYMGILFLGDNHVINENIVNTFCTRWNDGGGIYCIHRSTLGPSTKNCTVSNNIVYNGVGNVDGLGGSLSLLPQADGLYVDNGCELTTWTGNTSYNNSSRGMIVNFDTQKTTVQNNTFFGNKIVQVLFQEAQSGALSPVFPFNDGNHFNDNIVVSTCTQFCVEILSNDNDANYSPFDDSGSVSGNYYIRPYGGIINISRANGSSSAPAPYTLATWVTKYGETGGTEIVSLYNYLSPEKQETEVIIATNETSGIINVDPPDSTFEDIDGAAITNFNLNPYESKVYLRTTPIDPDILLDTFTAANGTSLAGRSPNIGPVPTIVSGTHAIQSNRMATTVFGIVTWATGTPDFQFTASRRMTSIADGLNTYVRRTDSNNIIIVNFTATTVSLFERNANPVSQLIAVANGSFKIDTEYFISIVANGSNVKVFVDGVLYIDATVTLLTGDTCGLLGNTTNTNDFVQAATL